MTKFCHSPAEALRGDQQMSISFQQFRRALASPAQTGKQQNRSVSPFVKTETRNTPGSSELCLARLFCPHLPVAQRSFPTFQKTDLFQITVRIKKKKKCWHRWLPHRSCFRDILSLQPNFWCLMCVTSFQGFPPCGGTPPIPPPSDAR